MVLLTALYDVSTTLCIVSMVLLTAVYDVITTWCC